MKNQTYKKEIINGHEVMVLISEEIIPEQEQVQPSIEELQAQLNAIQEQINQIAGEGDVPF